MFGSEGPCGFGDLGRPCIQITSYGYFRTGQDPIAKIGSGARSRQKRIPDPRSQIPDGATIKICVFGLQLDVLLVFWIRHSSSIVIFNETLCTAMRNFILFSSAVQRTLTCTCKAKPISTSAKIAQDLAMAPSATSTSQTCAQGPTVATGPPQIFRGNLSLPEVRIDFALHVQVNVRWTAEERRIKIRIAVHKVP